MVAAPGLGQGTSAVEILFGLLGLRRGAFDRRLGAFVRGFGGAQPLLRLDTAARIEKRRRRRHDRRDGVVGLHVVAGLEPHAGQSPSQGRGHHIAFAHPRLAVLIDGRHEFALGHRRGLDRHRARHHGPNHQRRGSSDAESDQDAAEGDLHGQSLVLRTATRSSRSMRRRTT